LDVALDEAIRLTLSKIGYIYFYDDRKKEFTLNTWSKDVMKECTISQPPMVYQLERTGIWGEAVRQAKPIIVNDFQAPNPLKKGYPEGHAKLFKYLTIPVFSGDKIVAVVAVANKEIDYDESDIRQLTLLMDSVWKIVLRRKAEEALRKSEEKLRIMFDSMFEGITVTDIHGVIENVNNATVRIHGYNNKDELIGLNSFNNMAERDRPRAVQNLVRLLNNENLRPEEYTLLKRDGSEFVAELYGNGMRDISGKLTGIFVIFRDITERKRAEEQALQIETLKRLNQAKSEFLANVSHELRTPLASIKGYIETLIETDVKWSKKQQLEFLQSADKQADKLN
jgi:two-component system, sensor histidine kinase and response regulator